MISRGIEVVDFNPDHWLNLTRGPSKTGNKKDPTLILVHKDEVIVHAVLGGKPHFSLTGSRLGNLSEMRRKYGAGRVICLERNLLRRVFSEGEGKLNYRMDYAEQIITLIRAFRSERGSGLRIDPPTPAGPVPPFALIQFIFDRLWPDDTSLLLYVIDETKNRIFTSLILRKQRGDIDLMTTDLHLGSSGLSARNWRIDRLRLIGSVTSTIAPVYMAIFTTLRAWRIWISAPLGSTPFKRLLREDSIIIEPYPYRIALVSELTRLVTRFIPRRR